MQTDVSKWNFGQMGSFFRWDLLESFLGWTFWIYPYKDKNSYKIGSKKFEVEKIMISLLVLRLGLFEVVLVASLPGEL